MHTLAETYLQMNNTYLPAINLTVVAHHATLKTV